MIKRYERKKIFVADLFENLAAPYLAELEEEIKKEIDVGKLFDDYIQQLKEEGRLGYAANMKQTRNVLAKINGGNLNFPISEITKDWLQKVEKAMRKSGMKDNIIGIYLRALRTIYNIAIEKKLVSREDYPFDRYKVSKPKEDVAHRALSHKDIQKVLNCPYPPTLTVLA